MGMFNLCAAFVHECQCILPSIVYILNVLLTHTLVKILHGINASNKYAASAFIHTGLCPVLTVLPSRISLNQSVTSINSLSHQLAHAPNNGCCCTAVSAATQRQHVA